MNIKSKKKPKKFQKIVKKCLNILKKTSQKIEKVH